MATCKGPNCGEEILWVTTRKYVTEAGHHRGGKSVPLDPEPNPAGNVVLEPGEKGRPVAVVLANDEVERYTGEKYMPHWRTCPDAPTFRKTPRTLVNRIDRDHEAALRLNRGSSLALVLVSLLAFTGCSVLAMGPEESFEWWTRKYEARMGLEERSEISFGETPLGSCGWVGYEVRLGRYGTELRLVTTYDPDKDGCKPPWDVAKHEACHRRMMHHHIDIGTAEAEAEVKKCERWYE